MHFFYSCLRRCSFLGLFSWLALSCCLSSHTAENRLWMASQSDFGAKRGFYLDFENNAPDPARPKLTTLRLILAVGDGKNWRFLEHTPIWQYGHDYQVKAIIAPGHDELWLDGVKVKEEPGAFLPQESETVDAGLIPSWAGAAAEYLLFEKTLSLTITGRKPLAIPLTDMTTLPQALALFEPQAPQTPPFQITVGQTLTIEATFRIVPRPADLHPLAPFLDRFGQPITAHFAGKVENESMLKAAAREESRRLAAWKTQAVFDRFGGSRHIANPEAATGFYHAVRRDGFWWLVTPLGTKCFYTGLDSAPALAWDKTPTTGREYLWQSLPSKTTETVAIWGVNSWGDGADVEYFAPQSSNMLRKYGPNWQLTEKALTTKRLQAWGFSGLGKWCDPLPNVPDIPVLHLSGVPTLGRHPDFFDPAIQSLVRTKLESQIAPRRRDPYVVGWSIGNEYDEIITMAEIKDILALPDATPAKHALLDEARTNLSQADPAKFTDADREHLRRFYADRYYDFLYRTVKAIDPNHLYLGFWIAVGWWENEEDWRLIAKHCDMVGYDNYSRPFASPDFARLLREADKPVLCGEFAFPPNYNGTRGFGFYEAAHAIDDADAGTQYKRWVEEAAHNPYCVGVCWFQYRDEPYTGRGPGHGPDLVYGEHYAFGMVDVTDTPKWNLVEPVRAENLVTAEQRQTAALAAK